VTGWESARQQVRGNALFASVEADWLGEDAQTSDDLRSLALELEQLEMARDQYLVLRARMAGPDTFGYSPADLDTAAEDYRRARVIVHDSVVALAARLTNPMEES
jgi:hypothetical protein